MYSSKNAKLNAIKLLQLQQKLINNTESLCCSILVIIPFHGILACVTAKLPVLTSLVVITQIDHLNSSTRL